MRALAGALEFADEDVSDAARGGVEHAEQDLAPIHDAAAERAGALWDLMVAARARIDALAVQEGVGADLAVAA